MRPDQWKEIKEKIRSTFDVDYDDVEDIVIPSGEKIPGTVEVIEFDGPQGLMRVEYTTKPKQVGRKVHTSTRIGAEGHEEIQLSDTETVNYLTVYKLNDDDEWVKVDTELFS